MTAFAVTHLSEVNADTLWQLVLRAGVSTVSFDKITHRIRLPNCNFCSWLWQFTTTIGPRKLVILSKRHVPPHPPTPPPHPTSPPPPHTQYSVWASATLLPARPHPRRFYPPPARPLAPGVRRCWGGVVKTASNIPANQKFNRCSLNSHGSLSKLG